MAVTVPAKPIMPFKKCLIVPLQDYNAFFFLLLLFWRHRVKCGDWKRPQTGVEPAPSAVELWSPKCWTLREVPTAHFPCCFCSVTQMCPNSLRPHGLQQARLPCSSLSPQVCSDSCPISQWCHPTISFSVFPFSSHLQSFPASGSFPMSQVFPSGGQSIGASASVLPMNIQDWFPLGWTGWISLQSKGLSRVFSNTTVQKHQFSGAQPSLWSNSHIHTWLLEKPELWLYRLSLAKRCLRFLICCLDLS